MKAKCLSSSVSSSSYGLIVTLWFMKIFGDDFAVTSYLGTFAL